MIKILITLTDKEYENNLIDQETKIIKDITTQLKKFLSDKDKPMSMLCVEDNDREYLRITWNK